MKFTHLNMINNFMINISGIPAYIYIFIRSECHHVLSICLPNLHRVISKHLNQIRSGRNMNYKFLKYEYLFFKINKQTLDSICLKSFTL